MSDDDEKTIPDILKELSRPSIDSAKSELLKNAFGKHDLSLFSDRTQKYLQDNLSAVNKLGALAEKANEFQKMAESVNNIFPKVDNSAFSKLAESISPARDYMESVSRLSRPSMPEFSIPHIPPNPIHETNDKLEDLLDHTEQTNQLLHGYIGESTKLLSTLNASILSMASDAAEDGKETRKQNRFMIWLAAGSLLLTALFSAWTYWDQSSDIKLRDLSEILSKNSEANTGFLEEIKRTNDIQKDELRTKILELETKVKTLESSKSKPQTVTTKQRPLPQ